MQTVVNNILAHYETLGTKQKETILILHGWGRNLGDWLYTGQRLSGKYRVVLLDLPGFGSSTPPQDIFDCYDYASFVEKFIKKTGIKKPILIGHSFGGKLSIILSSKPDFCKELFLIDASGVEEKGQSAKIKIAIYKILRSATKPLPRNIQERLFSLFASPDYQTAGKLRESFKKIVNQRVVEEARKIKVPTIIIWGEVDTEVEPKYALRLRSLIKNSVVRIVWGSSHSPHIEKPDKFQDLLEEYL